MRTAAVAAGVAALAAICGLALLMNIMERKQEAKNPFFRVVELTDDTADPAIWGKNFPVQYDAYKRTVDQVRTRYGGSEALPRTPSDADPRSLVAQSKLEEDPRLKAMWAGYAFAIDFREERGHAFMLADQAFTGRQAVPQPGACINCHASTYVAQKKAGDGDIAAAIAPSIPDSGIDLFAGVGGSPEAVLASAALKCLGGDMQSQMAPRDDTERAQLIADGWEPELPKIFRSDDLASGPNNRFRQPKSACVASFSPSKINSSGSQTVHSLARIGISLANVGGNRRLPDPRGNSFVENPIDKRLGLPAAKGIVN